MSHAFPLGRLRDDDTDRAEELFPFTAAAPATVERVLKAPTWLASHDQGFEGSCVGHAVALERAITNTAELRARGAAGYRRYDPIAVWRAAKAIDQWSFTKPEDENGTSVRAAYEIARTAGMVRVRRMELDAGGRPHAVGARDVSPAEGVLEYRWAREVDHVRAAIAAGAVVAIGVEWLTGFDVPTLKGRERWLPLFAAAGKSRGGHSVALAGASDRRQGFLLLNSWGKRYPPAWMPYETLGALLSRKGEAALVTDRLDP